MAYAYFGISLLAGLAVLLAYHPIRREPFTVLPSFTLGWLCTQVPLQSIVAEVIWTVLFAVFGAFKGWPGWVGLGVSVVTVLALAGQVRVSRASSAVVVKALEEVRSPSFPVPTERAVPTWGRWWRVTRALPLAGRSIEATKNIDYWDDRGRRHRLDIFRSKVMASDPAPVMIYVHGGAWVMGYKEQQAKPMMYELVARGWVCINIEYRLSPKAAWPAHIIDVKRAIAWVKEHIGEYGGDPSFVVITGNSAGGHLCSLAALTPGDPAFQPGFEEADTSVNACIPFYGVMDMTVDPAEMGRYGPGLRRMLEKSVMKVSMTEHPEVFEQASPSRRVNADAPPFLVFQGANDTLVPVDGARIFVERLRAVSTSPVAYVELPEAQHGFDLLASMRTQATTAGVVAFLDAVRASTPAPSSPATVTTPS